MKTYSAFFVQSQVLKVDKTKKNLNLIKKEENNGINSTNR